MTELPDDIARVWANDTETASALVTAWGEDTFRRSSVHRLAISESDRVGKMEEIRKAFIAARKKDK